MTEFRIAYAPIGVPTFHQPTAREAFERSRALLEELAANIVFPGRPSDEPAGPPRRPVVTAPDGVLLSPEALEEFVRKAQPSLLVVQTTTFANAAYIGRAILYTDAPILLWSLREPVGSGGRLKLNSLTGAFAAANLLRRAGRTFSYVPGSPDEPDTARCLAAAVRAAACAAALRGTTLLNIGHTPDGFGFGRADDTDLLGTFGIVQKFVEARELIGLASRYDDSDVQAHIRRAGDLFPGFADLPAANRRGYARLLQAYTELVKTYGAAAVASRCWPDFFTEFGTPVCAALSVLNDLGICAACETDALGALSMLIGRLLSGGAVFFGDPAALDEAENTVVFWHCGMAAPSLARGDEGPRVGLHCNRGIGPVMDFGCRGGGPVTVFRVGKDPAGLFRFFIGTGTALDRPKAFTGTNAAVAWNGDAGAMIRSAVSDGWEPHFTVIFGDCADELGVLADMLHIPAERY